MYRVIPLFALTVSCVGCSRPPAADAPQPTGAVQPVAVPGALGAKESPVQPPRAAAVEEFEYPADLGGRAVIRAVAPDRPAVPPIEGHAMRPRTHAAPAVSVDYIARPAAGKYAPVTAVPAGSPQVKLPAPPEGVPLELGSGSQATPSRPKFPASAMVIARSRDVALPPPLPMLGRPIRERVSLDDPTSEIANAAITSPAVTVPIEPAGFLRVSLPNPFELGEQIRPNAGPAVEPSSDPVPVDPRRVK